MKTLYNRLLFLLAVLSALPSFCYAQVRESGTGEPGPVKSQHLTAELISDLGTIAPATHVLPELLTRGVVLNAIRQAGTQQDSQTLTSIHTGKTGG
jgi:hypothetical protein